MASRNITDLHSDFQPMVKELLSRGQEAIKHTGYTFFITDGYRSMDEQAKLYASGRTVEGNVLTMAAPGQSPHNYGLAVDLAFQKDGKLSYSNDLYNLIDPIARSLGFILGVDWTKFKDRPHFEYPYWQSKKDSYQLEKSKPPLAIGKRYDSHRNLEVISERGVNVRVQPTTNSSSIGSFSYKQVFAVVAFVVGEEVSGNSFWWETQDQKYVWSGATNIIPRIPETTAVPEPIVTNSDSEVIVALKEQNDELRTALKDAIIEKKKSEDLYFKTQYELTTARSQASNVLAIQNANTALLTQVEAYKEKQVELKSKLRTAYTQAFEGWMLVQIPADQGRSRLIIPLIKNIIGLLFTSPKVPKVIGWKENALVVQAEELEKSL